MYIKKEDIIKNVKVQDGKLVGTTLEIDGKWVSNPTLEQVFADGWEEYTPPTPPTPPPYQPTYKELVVMYIRERYDWDDELAIQRQRDTDPEAFEEYFQFAEECKQRAHDEIENRDGNSSGNNDNEEEEVNEEE